MWRVQTAPPSGEKTVSRQCHEAYRVLDYCIMSHDVPWFIKLSWILASLKNSPDTEFQILHFIQKPNRIPEKSDNSQNVEKDKLAPEVLTPLINEFTLGLITDTGH